MRDKHSSKKIFFSIVAVLVVLTGATAGVIAHTQPGGVPHVAIVKTGANQFTQLSYQGEAGKSALVLLKTHASVVTKNSSYGVYVESINGVAGGTSSKYWMLYVNGKQAQVGASSYITKAGDVVTWKFE
ncbi:MAG TPA: DUF4430 domain-containing protein [Candidatus Saccharimonadales bacterium]|nr:DUF4430 domain-containing protein [Candidatus Saccharimonadales bacterium]